VRALTGNLIRIALISVALLIGLNAVGIDLTAFAVFSGAVERRSSSFWPGLPPTSAASSCC
jgi:hypothetical protein